MNGFSRFNIHKDYGNKDRLPSSHTCFNRKFLLSFYPTERVLILYLQSLIYPSMTATKH